MEVVYLADGSRAVALRPMMKSLLCDCEVLLPSAPGVERFVLQRAPSEQLSFHAFGPST